MRTRTRMRLYVAADETAGDARHYAEKAGKWLEKELMVEDSDGVAEAAHRLQTALGEHLARLAKELAKVEEQEYTERFRAKRLRKQREEQVAELSERLVVARTLMTGLYGRGEAVRHFGKGKTPRQPMRLVQLADRVIYRLRRPSKSPAPAPKMPGSVLCPDVMADHLDEMARKLETTLGELALSERGAGMYLLQKNQVEAKLELAQQDVARVLGGLYRLGGRERLDERVKKNHRKRRPRRRQRAATAEQGSTAAVKAARSTRKAVAAGAEVLTSAEDRVPEPSKLPTSAEDRVSQHSMLPASAEDRVSSRSKPSASPEDRVSEPSKLPTSVECRVSGSCEALPSRPDAVSERRAHGEPAETPVAGPTAHDTGALHPVRSRRAHGLTPSHPVAERGSNGKTSALPVPEREDHHMAA